MEASAPAPLIWSEIQARPHRLEPDGSGVFIRANRVVAFSTPSGERALRREIWAFDDACMPVAVRAWCDDFWRRLRSAPSLAGPADQWWSEYLTVLDGAVYRWTEDRHECSDSLDDAVPIERFLTTASARERAFVEAQLASEQGTT